VGIVCPEDCTEVYANGVDVQLAAAGEPGWKLDHWSGDLAGSSNPATVHMDGDKSVTAHFVQIPSDLSVANTDDPDPVAVGAPLTYTLVVTDNGPGLALGVTLTDTLPAGTTFVSASATQGTCDEAGGTVTCDVGTLAGGASTTVSIRLMAPSSPGTISNTATVSCTSLDPNPANNTATQDTTVLPDGDSDGVPDVQEMGPDGTDPNHDGNGDGIPDSQQDNAASLHTFDGQDYVTLATPPGTVLSGVRAMDNPSTGDTPASAEFPVGFFEFSVSGLTPGAATTVTLYLPANQTPTTYYKFGPTPAEPTPHWYHFMHDGQTGAVILDNVVTLHFVDGQRGDDDLVANGEFSDAGAPGLITEGAVPGQGTIGTQVAILGTGFGAAGGKAWLEVGGKALKFQVLSWTDTQIQALWKKKAPPGTYSLLVQPKGKGMIPIPMGSFEIMLPSIVGALSPETGSPGTAGIAISGLHFGSKKPKIYLSGNGLAKPKKCKVQTYSMAPDTGSSNASFVVPKLPAGTYDVQVVSKIGSSSVATGAFTVLAP
jgi:uncharacterized repeat protein (TIGR01451 family)